MSNSALKQFHLEAKSRKGQGAGVPLALPKTIMETIQQTGEPSSTVQFN